MPEGFDPRVLRSGALVAATMIAGPGTLEGAALLAAKAGVLTGLPLVAPATHGMLQLGGGFIPLIWVFLAAGVPHLLRLDLPRARQIVWPVRLVALALVAELALERVGLPTAVLAARCTGAVAALLACAVLWRARSDEPLAPRRAPVPVLLFALAVVPVAWLAYAAEALALVPSGLGAELLLWCAVCPVVLSMGFQMFSAMLQLPPGDERRFWVAAGAWITGALLRVATRATGDETLALAAAPLLLVGALAWLGALHGLRKRRGGLTLATNATPDLRAHIVVAVSCLIAGTVVGGLAPLLDMRALDDLGRHLVAAGFVLCMTMGVTLRALPRFCRGRPSSPPLAVATLALLVVALALRAGSIGPVPWAMGISAAASACVAIVWAAHLGRGLLVPARS